MANKFMRSTRNVKDVNKLSDNVGDENDIFSQTDGKVFIKTRDGGYKELGDVDQSQLDETNKNVDKNKSDITNIKSEQTKVKDRVTELETFKDEQDTKNSELDTTIEDLIARVEALETINVTGVKLDKSTLSLEEGATATLNATVEPSNATDKTVTFASSDKEIATVDNKGKVTAVKEGNADITVTTKDGNKTAKCTLTVTAKQIPVTGVTLDKSTLSLEEGATETLNATIAPSNASYKAVKFTSSDETIATVDDKGLVTAVKAGTADITVESLMDGSKTATCTVTVTETPPEDTTTE